MAVTVTVKKLPNRGGVILPEGKRSKALNYEALVVCGVGDVPTDADIEAALYAQHGMAIDIGYSVAEPWLRARSITTNWNGSLVGIQVAFEIPPTGSWKNPDSGDPLDKPYDVQWENFDLSEKAECDINGHPLVNGARVPFEGLEQLIRGKRLVVTQNLQYYDLPKWVAFENTVNADPVTIAGPPGSNISWTIPEECILCRSIIPPVKYNATARFVEIAFTYDILVIPNDSEAGYVLAPWDYRLRNEGKVGRYAGPSSTTPLGAFCNAKGMILDMPQLMDATGLPLDSTVKVLPGQHLNPVAAAGFEGDPPGSVVEQITVDSAVVATYLRYPKVKRSDFSEFPWFAGEA